MGNQIYQNTVLINTFICIKSKRYSLEIKWALLSEMGVFSKEQGIVLDHLGIN